MLRYKDFFCVFSQFLKDRFKNSIFDVQELDVLAQKLDIFVQKLDVWIQIFDAEQKYHGFFILFVIFALTN